MSSLSLATTSRPASIAGTDSGDSPASGGIKGESAPAKGHAPTQCQCGQDGKHYKEIALQTTLGTTPEKVFNLMFASEWVKGFMTGDQKLRGELSELFGYWVRKLIWCRARNIRLETRS